MKPTWRMWLLGVLLALSVMLILQGNNALRILVFVLLVGVLFVLTFVKQKSIRMGGIIVLILLSAFLIYNSFSVTGVVVKSVEVNSSLYDQGLTSGEIIKSINNITVKDKEDYANVMGNLLPSKDDVRIDLKTNKNEYTVFTNETPQLTIENIEKTNIKLGLDLQGGARALVEPDQNISSSQLDDLIQIARNRFNVNGLADVNIRGVTDLEGNKYMLVEIAGATPAKLEELIAQQGKFEAIIANQTVFEGGQRDIAGVCKNRAECAQITECSQTTTGYTCSFRFAVYLRQEAAEKHAAVTANISLDDSGQYLTDKLYLYVDGKQVDELLVGASLKGQVTTEISVQGSGQGKINEEAYKAAQENMNHLQTILITGSLPYKLNIVKLDTISPVLGKDFITLILIVAAAAIVLVSLIILARYRKIKASLAVLLTSFSEIVIILGFAALFRWNLDLPSIAGILATIGTGVDQQIVILDEAEKGEKTMSMKEKMKRALFIIVAAFATSVVSLIPLYWAGGGLFKGFMFTTIGGILIGVLITRPAFSDIIKKIEGE